MTRTARDAALGALAGTPARRAYRIAHDLLGDRAAAEDAVQEGLVRAAAAWGSLRDPEALEGWFLRVVTNLCLRALRRGRLWRAVGSLWRGASAEQGEAPPALEVVDPAPGPEVALATASDTAGLLRAVRGLPTMQRAALLLRYGHDLPVPEVARLLGVGPGTVKTHLVRGLERLRADLRSEP